MEIFFSTVHDCSASNLAVPENSYGGSMYVEGSDTSNPPQPRCAPQIRTTSVLMQSGHGEGTPPFCAVSPPHAGAVTGWRHERGAFARSPPARALGTPMGAARSA